MPDVNAGNGSADLGRIIRDAVPLAGVIGAALYGVLRLAYVFFYLQLRATPEEVGYGYSEILAGELIGAIELVFLVGFIFLVLGLVLHVVGVLVRGTGRCRTVITNKPTLARLAARSVLLAAAIVLVGLPVLAWQEGAVAAQGYTVRNVYLGGTIRLPVLAVAAVPATVKWTDVRQAGRIDVEKRGCLLYLGQTGGMSVFYDVASEESVRIPSGAIVVALQNTTAVPDGC